MEPKGTNAARHVDGADQAVTERRAHPRHVAEVSIRYRDIEGQQPAVWGKSRDLSLGGLCLLTQDALEVGIHLALEIHIADEPAPILALGRVVRGDGEESQRVSGIQFLWVSEEDRSNLGRLAEYFRVRYSDA